MLLPEQAVVVSLFPCSGPTSGGAKILVHGWHFSPSHSLFCRFGNADSAALFISSTQLSCMSPVHPPGLVAVEVSNNHMDFSTSRILHEFRAPLTVTSISPPRGAETGGTVLNVYGSNFFLPIGGIWCRFADSINVSAAFSSSSYVTCIAPRFLEFDKSRWTLL